MFKGVNIKQFLKVAMVICFAVFMLTGCGDDKNSQQNGAFADDSSTVADSHRECWQSGMIDLLYENMGKVAMGMYTRITDGALPLMMIAFALWTVFRLLKFVGSFTEDSPAEIWNEIVRKLFVCLICGLIASSTTQLLWLLNTIVFPIYYAFLELGAAILTSANGEEAFKTGKTAIGVFGESINNSRPLMCSAPAVGKASIENLSFPDGPRTMMDCMICAVNERLTLGYKLSFESMKLPGFMPILIGLFLLICFTFVKLGFVFYLVDSIFRFTMMVTILPVLVMSYAFKQTESWAKTGFKTIINSAALMMFIAVMIAMALLAMEQILSDNSGIFNNGMSFTELSVPFMCLILVGFLILSSIKLAQQVTNSLVGGNSDSAFARRAATLAATIAKGAFKGAWGLISRKKG